RV
ncbi:hypothetical protein PF005_g33052, partial [Phytophthora fragariae]